MVIDGSERDSQVTAQSSGASRRRMWTVIAAGEVMLAVAAVLLDLFIVTLVLLALALLSLLIRRQGPASLGLRRPARAGRLVVQFSA